jgi:hypothetical protein
MNVIATSFEPTTAYMREVDNAVSSGSNTTRIFTKDCPWFWEVPFKTKKLNRVYMGQNCLCGDLTSNCIQVTWNNVRQQYISWLEITRLFEWLRMKAVILLGFYLRAYTQDRHKLQTVQFCQYLLAGWKSRKIKDPKMGEQKKAQVIGKLSGDSDCRRYHALSSPFLLTTVQQIGWIDSITELGRVMRPVRILDAEKHANYNVAAADVGCAGTKSFQAKGCSLNSIKYREECIKAAMPKE